MKSQCPWPDAPHVGCFQANKPINLRQLQADLETLRPTARVWDLLHESTKDGDQVIGYLWVNFGSDPISIGSLEKRKDCYQLIREMIESHVCDPNFGLSPFWRQYNEIQDDLFRDPDVELPVDELTVLVKGLVLKSQFPPQED